jgi:hypothetical protein
MALDWSETLTLPLGSRDRCAVVVVVVVVVGAVVVVVVVGAMDAEGPV